ncbi:MAG: hypothetical protein ACRCWQ_14505 [Bacilli bacterium]
MKKYKLLERESNGLCRIQALRDFGNVKAGDIGGFVEDESNLSHHGNCWIYDNAMARGESVVADNAKMRDHSVARGNALVHGDAIMSGRARISEHASASDTSMLYENAIVCGNVMIENNTTIFGRSSVNQVCTKTPVNLLGFYYTVTITDKHMRVGCQCHTFEEWKNFTTKEILEMDGKEALKFYRDVLVPVLLPMCEAHKNG